MTSESVRAASAQPDLNHRDPSFAALIGEIRSSLLAVYGLRESDWKTYLIGGSGTAAMEAMISSCVENGPVLILANGYYSERLDAIFEVYGLEHKTMRFGWLDPWDLDAVALELSSGRYEAVVGVHHETTSGRLNSVQGLARIAEPLGVRVLVDAVSSFGADLLEFDGIDAVCGVASKCLHGIPGVSFVLARRALSETMRRHPRRSFYLSLPMYEGDSPPLTPPVPALLAFRQALREFEAQGSLGGRHERYSRQSALLRKHLARLAFEFAVPAAESSVSLTVPSLPTGFSYDAWFKLNFQHGFELYGCKGELSERFFQVSNMGEVRDDQIESWLGVVAGVLRAHR